METRTINGMVVSGDGSKFTVLSTSGNTYNVTYCGCGDGDPEYIALWKCDCPAGRHGKSCKHVAAVSQYCDEIDS